MKSLILLSTFISLSSIAGVSGQGSLGSGGTKPSIRQTLNPHVNANNGIVFYQGETTKDIYFQFGKSKGNKWSIQQFKMESDSSLMQDAVRDALTKSKQTKDWAPILEPQLQY